MPLYEQVRAASSCQNDVILPWTQRQDPGQDVPGTRARSTRRRPSRCPASPARAARATPTASGSACCVDRRRSTPTRSAPTSSSSPATPLQGVNPPARRTTRARRCGPTCRARPSSRPTCARSPQAGPHVGSTAAARRRSMQLHEARCRTTVDWLRKRDQGSRASNLKVSDVAGQPLQELTEVKRAIRKHLRDFAAIVALAVIAAAASAATCSPTSGCASRGRARRSSSRPSSPPRRPSRRARARPCASSGVRVGDITKVDLQGRPRGRDDGPRPEVQGPRPHRRDRAAAAQDRAEGHVHRARPGHGRAPRAKAGWTHPGRATRCPTSTPTRSLASLDADTRDYLQAAVDGAGQGLDGRGDDLREVFRRFEPTHRDLARVNGAVAQRHRNLRRLVHSLGELNAELAGKDDRPRRSSSTPPRRCSARSPPRSRTSAARSATCPARCARRRARWARSSASPTSLRPAAARPAPGGAGARPRQRGGAAARQGGDADRPRRRSGRSCATRARSCASLKRAGDRPRGVDARPDAARSRCSTTSSTSLGYNPNGRGGPGRWPDRDEGYLFWLAWLQHNGAALFSTSRRQRPVPPGHARRHVHGTLQASSADQTRRWTSCSSLDAAPRRPAGLQGSG